MRKGDPLPGHRHGVTSREVGAQLFLSPRTIETHLRKIFRKRGITTRRELKELHLP
ncbi:helix-turn-helix transcriptional regulator [Micromonospora sp. NPDC048898]|uniref:helix-turn-helix domain-containing protein n=1 Tax=Micromonospora sp. NPDC048898 TaxID=3364260 RepID=UPI003713CB5F